MFIVFEGLDGVGKSTIVASLCRALLDRGFFAVATAEPYLDKNARTAEEFIHDRARHVEQIIAPLLEHKNAFVLCDRYVYSTAAYQATSEEARARLVQLQAHFPKPDATFLLCAPLAVLQERLEGRGKMTGFDTASVEFKRRVQSNYEELARQDPTMHIFDTNDTLDNVVAAILAFILQLHVSLQ